MSGAIPPLPQNALMAWYSVKAQGQLYLYFYRNLYASQYIIRVIKSRKMRRAVNVESMAELKEKTIFSLKS
jgi:hypothetical protein